MVLAQHLRVAVCPHADKPLTQTFRLQHHSALLSHLDVCRIMARNTTSSLALKGLFLPQFPPAKLAAGAVGFPQSPRLAVYSPFPPFSLSRTLLAALISSQAHNCFSDPVLLPQYPVFPTPTMADIDSGLRRACLRPREHGRTSRRAPPQASGKLDFTPKP